MNLQSLYCGVTISTARDDPVDEKFIGPGVSTKDPRHATSVHPPQHEICSKSVSSYACLKLRTMFVGI